MFPEGNVFREECGKAFACHERACLYASDVKQLEEVELNAAPPLDLRGTNFEDDIIRSEYITNVYLEALHLLMKRLERQLKEYQALHEEVLSLTVVKDPKNSGEWKRFLFYLPLIRKVPWIFRGRSSAVGERDAWSVMHSVGAVVSRVRVLTDFINERTRRLMNGASPQFPLEDQWEEYKRDWVGLDKMCRALMEEITFLRTRNDEFTKTVVNYRGQLLTTISILVAALSILVTILMTIPVTVAGIFANAGMNLWLDYSKGKAAAAKDQVIAAAIADLATNRPAGGAGAPVVVDVSPITTAIGEAGSKLDTLVGRMANLEMAVVSHNAAIRSNTVTLAEGFGTMTNALAANNAGVAANLGVLNTNVAAVRQSVDGVARAVRDKEMPPVNVNFSQRTIGWSKSGTIAPQVTPGP